MTRQFDRANRPAPTAVAVVAIAVLALAACMPGKGLFQTRAAITVAAPALEQNALLYVAEAQRLFQKNGLDVTLQDHETGVTAMNALLGGDAQIAQLAEFPFIKPVLEKQPVRILAVNNRFENDYLLVRTDRGIANIPDLKGKRIGVIRGTILEFYLGRFLELNGIPRDGITIVDTVSPAQTAAAIDEGDLDAVVAFQPHVDTIQTRLGNGVMVWPVQENQLAYGILVAQAGWVTQNGDTVERFLKSLAEAEDYLATHPDRTMIILQNRLDLDGDYIRRVWPLHQFSLSLDYSLIMALNDEARWMIDNGRTTATSIPEFSKYVYVEALEAVRPEAVTINP